MAVGGSLRSGSRASARSLRGCLVWGAIGDALGRTAEGRSPARLQSQFGPSGLRDYVAWHAWRPGEPRGTFTDDTQLTIATAESLLASGGELDPQSLADAFLGIDHIRGIGRATAHALEALRRGAPWWETGQKENSAGNGAAMRAAPVGLVHAFKPAPVDLVRDAVLSAVPTHPHPVGVAGAVALAAGAAWCIRARLSGAIRLDVERFVEFVSTCIERMEPEPTPERKPGGRAVRLVERLRELPDLLSWPSTADVFGYTHNGAFALESVPAALYTFLHSPDDPEQVILTAVNAGYDADTVASMAGNLVGAWCGTASLQRTQSWWIELEDRQRLLALADRLLETALVDSTHVDLNL